MLGATSARQVDENGFITIEANPISRSGVFQYSGRCLPDANPDLIYNVYRPAEELADPEAINSFKMIPLFNEHVMVGDGFAMGAEEKGVHGSTGTDVFYNPENGVLYSTLRIFSNTLKSLLEMGKTGLSLGYRCVYEKTSGVFNGEGYDYIQRQLRGNHIALVQEGRMGKDIVVLDHAIAFDHFDLALDQRRESAMDQDKEAASEEKKAMTLEEAVAVLEKIVPQIEAMNAAIAALGTKTEEAAEAAAVDEDDGDKEEKEEKKEGMDAAEVKALHGRVEGLEKEIFAKAAKRDRLAKEVSEVIGTFDHAEMTLEEVSSYACDKLGLKPEKGQEQAAIQGFMAGRKAAAAKVGFVATDSKSLKQDGLLAKRLNAKQG